MKALCLLNLKNLNPKFMKNILPVPMSKYKDGSILEGREVI